MNTFEAMNLLERLGKETVKWEPGTGGRASEFTDYSISKANFKQMLEIVKEELLLVLPKTNQTGLVEGYDIHDLQGFLLLRFGANNLPKDCGYTLEKLFKQLVRSEENVEIHKQLKEEGKIKVDLQETFTVCCAQ